ncbi:MAG: DUF3810 family protein, partial [Proteobacteria bacterium]
MQRKYLLPVLLPVQIVLVRVVALFPEVVEHYYSTGFYPVISQAERTVFGWLPFSFGDIAYGIVGFFALRWLWKTRKTWRGEWRPNLRKVTAVLSVVYFLFHLLWAMNYHRVKLPEKLGLRTDYDRDQLVAFTARLIEKTNGLQLDITSNPDARVETPYLRQDLFLKGVAAYANLERDYPNFALRHASLKTSLLST